MGLEPLDSAPVCDPRLLTLSRELGHFNVNKDLGRGTILRLCAWPWVLATGLAGDGGAGMSRPRVCPWSDWARGPERVSCHGCGTLCPEEWLQCSVDPSGRPELDTPRDSVGSHLWPWSPERSALARPLVRAGQLSGVIQPGLGGSAEASTSFPCSPPSTHCLGLDIIPGRQEIKAAAIKTRGWAPSGLVL